MKFGRIDGLSEKDQTGSLEVNTAAKLLYRLENLTDHEKAVLNNQASLYFTEGEVQYPLDVLAHLHSLSIQIMGPPKHGKTSFAQVIFSKLPQRPGYIAAGWLAPFIQATCGTFGLPGSRNGYVARTAYCQLMSIDAPEGLAMNASGDWLHKNKAHVETLIDTCDIPDNLALALRSIINGPVKNSSTPWSNMGTDTSNLSLYTSAEGPKSDDDAAAANDKGLSNLLRSVSKKPVVPVKEADLLAALLRLGPSVIGFDTYASVWGNDALRDWFDRMASNVLKVSLSTEGRESMPLCYYHLYNVRHTSLDVRLAGLTAEITKYQDNVAVGSVAFSGAPMADLFMFFFLTSGAVLISPIKEALAEVVVKKYGILTSHIYTGGIPSSLLTMMQLILQVAQMGRKVVITELRDMTIDRAIQFTSPSDLLKGDASIIADMQGPGNNWEPRIRIPFNTAPYYEL